MADAARKGLIYQLREAARPGGRSRKGNCCCRHAYSRECVGNSTRPGYAKAQRCRIRHGNLLAKAAHPDAGAAAGPGQGFQRHSRVGIQNRGVRLKGQQDRRSIREYYHCGLNWRGPDRHGGRWQALPIHARHVRLRRGRSGQAQAAQCEVGCGVRRAGRQLRRRLGLRQLLLHRQRFGRGKRGGRKGDGCKFGVGQVPAWRGLSSRGDIATFRLVV